MANGNNNPIIRGPGGVILTPSQHAEKTYGFEQTGLAGETHTTVDLEPFEGTPTIIDKYGTRGAMQNLHDRQGYGEMFLKGVGNILNTAVGEAVKTLGYAGGALWDLGDGVFEGKWDLDSTLNNEFNKNISEMQDYVRENWTAVHKPADFQDKSLGQQLLDPTFWATEGADGVGFLLSMLAPGQAIKAASWDRPLLLVRLVEH